MKIITAIITTFLLTLSIKAFAWGDIDSLKGKTVIYAGSFNKLSCYRYGNKYDCLNFPHDLLETNGIVDGIWKKLCFKPQLGALCIT